MRNGYYTCRKCGYSELAAANVVGAGVRFRRPGCKQCKKDDGTPSNMTLVGKVNPGTHEIDDIEQEQYGVK